MKHIPVSNTKIYIGNTEIKKAYLNSDLVSFKKEKYIDCQVGDAVLYDRQEERITAAHPEDITSLLKERYEPIGVVAIPTSHNIYGTWECGVMALLSASLNRPDIGLTSEVGISWGTQGTDYLELNNYSEVASMGTMDSDIQSDVTTLKNRGFMPLMRSGMNAKFPCPHDPITSYYNVTSSLSSYGYIPSPYLADGSRNPAYYQTEFPSSTANALSDFAGKSNTEFLCSKATAQTDWKTATFILDPGMNTSETANYHPAACACWRYHTTGTSLGDWYLPACGELGYCAARYDKIKETMKTFQSHFNISLCQLLAEWGYWSSSENGFSFACIVNFGQGSVSNSYRFNSYYVRPFMRLKITS